MPDSAELKLAKSEKYIFQQKPLSEILSQVEQGTDYVQIDDMRFQANSLIRNNGFSGSKWTTGVVYYVFDSSVDATNRQRWLDAAQEWSTVADLTFTERTTQDNYIYVKDDDGNWSYVGMIGGKQDMGIYNWTYKYIIAHEIGHALGLSHEQSRSDRDSYVNILWGNIQTGMEYNFELDSTINYGSYDFDSVMHYGKNSFSKNGSNTIEPILAYSSYLNLIGQRNHLSNLDKSGMATRYANNVPIGSFDSATCDSLSGWTKDPDTASPISVHFYKDGPAGTGTFIGSILADSYRGDLSYADKNHGFSFALPDSLNDGVEHQVYAYAIDSAGGTNPLLTNSPKIVQCGLTPDQLTAVMSVINDIIMEDSPLPDLTVVSPSASKIALAPSENLTFSTIVKNDGAGASAATTLRWYRSTDATISTADTQLGSQAVAALSAGQTSPQNISLTAPSTAGTYWLGACADAVSGESSTTNNCSAGVQITVTATAKPDLTVISPSASKTLLAPSESFTFSATVKNSGTASSAATTLRWYRSTDATISTADTALGSAAVGALSADQTSAQSTTLTAPAAAGTYWLGACADAVSGESSATNNCSAGVQITVTATAKPDLTVISPSASKTSLAPSESFTFSATVQNSGTASAAATTLRWYRSTDATISTADTALGSAAVGALSANQTSAQSVSLTAPAAAGTYWLGACADAVSGESSATNNCSAGVQITVTSPPTAPDLTVINPSASKTSLAPSESFTFSATVKNSGTASSAATTLRWYRSTDAAISAADTALGSAAVGALSASQTSAQNTTLTAPAAAGTYWLGACADAVSSESSATNNCSAGVQIAVTTTGKPDLTVYSLQFPYQFDAGDSGSVTAGFYNQGTLASVATTATCYYINKAAQAVSGAVCQMQVPALAVNQTVSRTATLAAPCSEGDYTLKVCVNSGANAESNSSNNCMYGDFSVIGNCQNKAFLPAVELLLH